MVELASDFLDRNTPVFRDDVCFFISQSGELLLLLLFSGVKTVEKYKIQLFITCCMFQRKMMVNGPGLS